MPSAASLRSSFWLVVAGIVALDRVTKVLLSRLLEHGADIVIAGDYVQLHLVHNTGAAFGLNLGPWSRWIFTVIAIGAVVLLHRMWREANPADHLRRWAVAVVAGGAAGNLVDRLLTSRGVIDFIDVGVGTARWPTFNVADIAVSCGAVALALSLWREDHARRPTTATS
jgi:signal peptidase II